MTGVDLDVLAAGYAYRPVTAPALARAVRLWDLAGAGPGSVLVDVGGGRGELAAVWAEREGRAVLVDPSPAMLAEVPARVTAVRGRAEALPLATGVAAGVMFHMSLHHTRWQLALDEAARVLRPGGRLGIWTMGPDDIAATMLARWFPSVVAVEARRFPHPDLVRARLENCGFTSVTAGRDVEPVIRTAGEWRAAVRARFVSTLQLLAQSEIDAGLEAFGRAHPDPEGAVRYERRFACLLATRGHSPVNAGS